MPPPTTAADAGSTRPHRARSGVRAPASGTPAADIDLSGVTLRVGDQVNITKSALEAAGQADTPYRIEWATFSSGPPLLEALNADAIDIGGVGDAPPIFAAVRRRGDQGRPGHADPPDHQGILVPSGSDITDVADLAGKTIAVAQGSSAHWVLLKALAGPRPRRRRRHDQLPAAGRSPRRVPGRRRRRLGRLGPLHLRRPPGRSDVPRHRRGARHPRASASRCPATRPWPDPRRRPRSATS